MWTTRILFAALVTVHCLHGQIIAGTILGTVTDRSGGFVVVAEVAITNTGTNLATRVRTNSCGSYEVLHLPPGFTTAVRNGLTLEGRTDSGSISAWRWVTPPRPSL